MKSNLKGKYDMNNINKMRNIIMTAKAGENLLEKLKLMNDWKLQPLNIPGSFKYCLEKNGTRIALYIKADNIIHTVNVLPYDWEHDQDSANAALMELSQSLENLS